MIDDHFPYSHELNDLIRGDLVRRNKMPVTLSGLSVNNSGQLFHVRLSIFSFANKRAQSQVVTTFFVY